MHAQVIGGTAMPVVSAHHRTDHLTVHFSDEEQAYFESERKLNGWDNTQKHAIYDNTIGFNIELRGLSSNYGLGTQQMLRSNILPYQSSL